MNKGKTHLSARRGSTEHSETNETIEDDEDDTSIDEEEEARAKKVVPVKVLTAADIARMEFEAKNVESIKKMLSKWKRIKERTVTGVRAKKLTPKSTSRGESLGAEVAEQAPVEGTAEEREEEADEGKEGSEEEEKETVEKEFDIDDFDGDDEKDVSVRSPEEKTPEELYSPTSSSFSDSGKENQLESSSETEDETIEKEEMDDGALLAPFIAELFMSEEQLIAARQNRMRESVVLLNEGSDDVVYRRQSYVSARNPSTSSDTNFDIVLSSSDEDKYPQRTTRLYHKLRLLGEEIVVARDHRKALRNKQEEGEEKYEQKEFNEIDFSKLKGLGFFFNEESLKKKQICDKFRVRHVQKTLETMMEEIEGGTPEELAKRKEFEKESVVVKPGLRKKLWQRMVWPHFESYVHFLDEVEAEIERETLRMSFHESGQDLIDLRYAPGKQTKSKGLTSEVASTSDSELKSTPTQKSLTRRESVKMHLDSLKNKDMKFQDAQRRSRILSNLEEARPKVLQGKPYHEVCRDRIKQVVKEYRAMFRDELELLAKGQTFALRGVQIQRQFEVGVQKAKKCGEILQPWTYKQRQRIENLLAS